MSDVLPDVLARLQIPSIVVGVVVLLACGVGLLINPSQFFIAYLYAFLFWLGISLGAMAFGMLHWLVNGRWGLLIRRFQEAAAGTIPLMALFFIPVGLAVHLLFPWANVATLASDEALRHKTPYLNVPFWTIRAVIYFSIWTALAMLLRHWGLQAERSGKDSDRTRVQKLCAVGILIYFITMTFAAIDWNMSRDPHYYSTIFGFIVVVGQALEGLAFAILLLTLLARRQPFREALAPQPVNDLGSLLFTLVILFAYMEFVQYLINWSGNAQEEISWYTARNHSVWRGIAIILILFHFFVPFFVLLSRENKRNTRVLAGVATLLLVMRLLDGFWMVAPSGTSAHAHQVEWVAVVFACLTPLGIGGLWFAAFLWLLSRRPLLPATLLESERSHGHAD